MWGVAAIVPGGGICVARVASATTANPAACTAATAAFIAKLIK